MTARSGLKGAESHDTHIHRESPRQIEPCHAFAAKGDTMSGVNPRGPTRQVRISFDKPQTLDAKGIADLVGMYQNGDSLTKPIIAWEIERRITGVKSTALVFRFLCPRNTEDAKDAFDGLVAVCFRAKGNLFVVDPPDNLYWATKKFIILQMMAFLEPYTSKQPTDILRAALEGKFQHIPRFIKLRIIDEVRRHSSRQRKTRGLKFASLDYVIGESDGIEVTSGDLIPHDVNQFGSSLGASQPESLWKTLDFVIDNEFAFRPKFGDSWQTLLCLSDAEREEGETWQDWKGRVTKLISEGRGINPRQARKRKDELRNTLRRLAKEAIIGTRDEWETVRGSNGKRIYAKPGAE